MFAHAHEGVVVAAAVLLVAGCSGPKPEISGVGQKTGSPPDTSNVKITGDASDPVNKIVIQAIADLEKFWGEQFPTGLRKGVRAHLGRLLRRQPLDG